MKIQWNHRFKELLLLLQGCNVCVYKGAELSFRGKQVVMMKQRGGKHLCLTHKEVSVDLDG